MSSVSQEAWDEICVNPYQSQSDIGREEGRAAGLAEGFNDGFALGRSKGIEFGMELGFIRGFLETVERRSQASGERDSAQNERLQKRVIELREAIDDFPGPEVMFSNSISGEESDRDEKDDSERLSKPTSTDIMGSMQRIRAKFKVLTAQLKVPHFSLKQVMADSTVTEDDMPSKSMKRSDKQAAEASKIASSEW